MKLEDGEGGGEGSGLGGMIDFNTFLTNVLREAFDEKKGLKFFIFSKAEPSLASSHWLRPDLDAPDHFLSSDDLILIVLRY